MALTTKVSDTIGGEKGGGAGEGRGLKLNERAHAKVSCSLGQECAEKPSGFPADRGTGIAWRERVGWRDACAVPPHRGAEGGARRGGCVPRDLGNLVQRAGRLGYIGGGSCLAFYASRTCYIPRHHLGGAVRAARTLHPRTHRKVYVTMDFNSRARARAQRALLACSTW